MPFICNVPEYIKQSIFVNTKNFHAENKHLQPISILTFIGTEKFTYISNTRKISGSSFDSHNVKFINSHKASLIYCNNTLNYDNGVKIPNLVFIIKFWNLIFDSRLCMSNHKIVHICENQIMEW